MDQLCSLLFIKSVHALSAAMPSDGHTTGHRKIFPPPPSPPPSSPTPPPSPPSSPTPPSCISSDGHTTAHRKSFSSACPPPPSSSPPFLLLLLLLLRWSHYWSPQDFFHLPVLIFNHSSYLLSAIDAKTSPSSINADVFSI